MFFPVFDIWDSGCREQFLIKHFKKDASYSQALKINIPYKFQLQELKLKE